MTRAILKIVPFAHECEIIEVENKPLDLNFIKSLVGDGSGTALLYPTIEQIDTRHNIVIFSDISGWAKGLAPTAITINGNYHGNIVIAYIEKLDGFNCDYYGLTPEKVAIVTQFIDFKKQQLFTKEDLN